MIVSLLGGIGLFLLGMSLMTDGLKAVAGGALRRVLTRSVRGPVSGLMWGTGVTALVQSSTATTMTTIGFVSAGLLTFPQAVGVVFGANLGATSTGWLVSMLGLKFSLGQAALPLVFGGAMLKLLGRERAAAAGLAMAGFGLLFIGIDQLQAGMSGLAERLEPADLPSGGWGARAMLVGIGLVMTIIMQSSSAAVAMTLTAVSAGTVTLDQAAAMVIGQNVGSAVTTAIAAVGASAPAKRTAVAHVLFNVLTAMAAFVLLPVLTRVVEFAAAGGSAGPGVIELAAFHTAFNVLGVCLLLPMVRPFSALVMRIVPERGPSLTRRLDRTVAHTGAVGVEAARRTVAEIAAEVVGAARALVQGEPSHRETQGALAAAEEALRETRGFVGGLGGAPQGADERRRHVSTLHALDHVSRLLEACREGETIRAILDGPTLADVAARTASSLAVMQEWLRGTGDESLSGEDVAGSAPVALLRGASAELAERRRTDRVRTLERTAAGELDPDRALEEMEAVRWLDRIAYHVWRTAHHLQEPAPGESVTVAEAFGDTPLEAANGEASE